MWGTVLGRQGEHRASNLAPHRVYLPVEKRYDHSNSQMKLETQSPVAFAVSETMPDKSWHFSVWSRREVSDTTTNRSLSPESVVLGRNLMRDNKARSLSACWGPLMNAQRKLVMWKGTPQAPQISHRHFKTEELLCVHLLPQPLVSPSSF